MRIKSLMLILIFLLTISIIWLTKFSVLSSPWNSHQIKDVASLIEAVNKGHDGDQISLGPGRFELTEPLHPKSGMTIVGSGKDLTLVTAISKWQANVEDLPHTENPTAYLFSLEEVNNVVLSNMKLTGNGLHGAIYAKNIDGLELVHLHIEDFLWSSVRTFGINNLRVHDNVFVDAGDRYGSTTGAALYMNWTKNSEFWNNRIYASANSSKYFFGFKGNKGTDLKFHHNDVAVDFSFEFPFQNDRNIEIDHNYFQGTVSIPKHAGGTVVEGELTYHIHHNWFKKSYALEWSRNSVEVNHNLFDFNSDKDDGNLIANFGKAVSQGFTLFHDNLIKNPGRGIFWTEGIYNQFYFYNNHVIANTLTHQDGFFGFNPLSNFKTIKIKNNIIENIDRNPRPLMRNKESYAAIIENNVLKDISDTSAYKNPTTKSSQGLSKHLSFKVGVNEEYSIHNWKVMRAKKTRVAK